MKKTFVNKIAQLTLALALTIGYSLGAQAASMDDVIFGKSANDVVVQSQTASFAGFIDLLPNYNLVADSKVEPFMGSEIDLVKYAFVYDMLFDVEANFKNNTIDEYNKLREKMIAKYGPGEDSIDFDKESGRHTKRCVWKAADKVMELAYVSNKIYDFHNLYLNVFCVKAGDKI